MSASAAISTSRLVVEAGASDSTELTIRNTGLIVDEYHCEVLGEAAPWSVVEPSTITLLPGTEAVVTVTVRPPRSAMALAGSRQLAVRIRAREQDDADVVEEAELEVLPFLELSGEILPHTTQARRWGESQVALDNRGNRPAQLTLVPADPDQVLEFRLREESVVVLPGEAAFVLLRLRGRKRHLAGRPKTFPFAVAVEPDDGDVFTLTGAVQQQARIPYWLMRALVLSGVGVIVLMTLWFALLKPTLESTAVDAVERQVAAAQDAAQTAGAQAGAAGEAATAAGAAADEASGAAAAGATADGAVGGDAAAGAEDAAAAAAAADAAAAAAAEEQAAAAASAAGLSSGAVAGQFRPGLAGDPFDFRLSTTAAAGAGGLDVYLVPEGRILALTDIVLQNPRGDRGTLQVRRGDGVLIEVRLENFRDLDYHFVAPIVFGETQQVAFAITCEREDGAQCQVAGYFLGYLSTIPAPAPAPSPAAQGG